MSSRDISATVGNDYNGPVNQTLNWADGESGLRSLSINIVDDLIDEGDETFELSLTAVSANAEVSAANLTVTIQDRGTIVLPESEADESVLDFIAPIVSGAAASRRAKQAKGAKQRKE